MECLWSYYNQKWMKVFDRSPWSWYSSHCARRQQTLESRTSWSVWRLRQNRRLWLIKTVWCTACKRNAINVKRRSKLISWRMAWQSTGKRGKVYNGNWELSTTKRAPLLVFSIFPCIAPVPFPLWSELGLPLSGTYSVFTLLQKLHFTQSALRMFISSKKSYIFQARANIMMAPMDATANAGPKQVSVPC